MATTTITGCLLKNKIQLQRQFFQLLTVTLQFVCVFSDLHAYVFYGHRIKYYHLFFLQICMYRGIMHNIES